MKNIDKIPGEEKVNYKKCPSVVIIITPAILPRFLIISTAQGNSGQFGPA